ncbi:hypothetical protein P153DRAFT_157884 [Dothidotthia symphoricarpi CBS 119687]|uniref:RBR-type E3 ubiquitin transferase n=1 Tax=Dothidotthia symphoricarpi CBS 119687 TaxID=1392245 RepID=A0A6A6AQL2_9PLEO|nr:uncharacterized protein P153DRAFT_157884 [Dothidotthia symphoricarpi CBS 119687]KAF2133493.1 hypothetical protein P153DRAFT_157884 [Dothidotthia symphoricarpi CBS 119687]
MALGMARSRDERGNRFYDDGQYLDENRDRTHRHRHRTQQNDDDEYTAAKRERRERRRQAEVDLDEVRAKRESYYARQEPEPQRYRDHDRMAQATRTERTKEPRSSQRETQKDAARKTTKKKRETLADHGVEDFVFGRPKSSGYVEEVTVRRSSTRRRSEEGGSSRTAYTPLSGSGSASVRRVEIPKPSRTTSTREQAKTTTAREPTRTTSTREPSRTHASRPSTRHASTPKPSPVPAPAPISRSQSIRETATPISRSQSAREASRKSTGGLLSSLFRAPPPRTPSAPVYKEPQRVECLVCMNDDLPLHKTVKLACGHRMCNSCLKRQFTLSAQDAQHMPPTCCTAEHIPLKYAERLFDDKFKKLWNKKYQEYTTANRLYCPSKGCGEWIKPSKIRMDLTYGRKYARCGRCTTKVCVLCSAKFHTKRECPKDEETNRLVQMAKEKGWQRCYNCKAVVELKEGCNHMTCRCTAQFCMVCALPWKTCDCPWFNYQHIDDDDRLNDARVPQARQQDVIEVIEMPDDPAPLPARRSSTRTRQRTERERPAEQPERVLAARLQSRLHLNPTPTASERSRANPVGQVHGLGNAGGHHMNESYAVRPTPPVAQPRARAPPPRTSFFSSRRVSREAPVPARPTAPRVVTASAMAGLSRDGTKRGANRVGTWLSHIMLDAEAINTQARDVEVDDWRCDGTMIGID